MRVAAEQSIPVLLGDAPQNDTIRSIHQLASPDTVNPDKLVKDMKSLLFTAFGVVVPFGPALQGSHSRVKSDVLSRSQFISIPGVYIESTDMLRSLFPILLISLLPALLDAANGGTGLADAFYAPFGGMGALNSALGVSTASAATATAAADVLETTASHLLDLSSLGLGTSELPDSLFTDFSFVVDAISALVLVRMAKIIGADRDVIIAQKVQAAARAYPNKELVVVIGMLHCNGVARHLMSGDEPSPSYE